METIFKLLAIDKHLEYWKYEYDHKVYIYDMQTKKWKYVGITDLIDYEEYNDHIILQKYISVQIEKLTNDRAEALAKMPKRVEYSTTVETLPHYSSGSTGFRVEHTFKPEFFPHGTKVKVIIEEVQE